MHNMNKLILQIFLSREATLQLALSIRDTSL